jgi:polysaccharide biosynthesis transport protein
VPAYPKKLPSVLIAAVATLMLSCGFVLTKSLLSAPGAAVPVPRTPVRDAGAAATAQPDTPAELSEDRRRFVGARFGGVADVVQRLHGAGAGRIAVLAAAADLDSGEAAIKLARALANGARVVLVGLDQTKNSAVGAISDALAPGLAEFADGSASFRDIIDKDKLSALHVISPGREPSQRIALLSSPRLVPGMVALARSYDYVVIDAGLAEGADLEAIGEIAPRAVLLAGDGAHDATEAARGRLFAAEFDDVIVLTGSSGGEVNAEAA